MIDTPLTLLTDSPSLVLSLTENQLFDLGNTHNTQIILQQQHQKCIGLGLVSVFKNDLKIAHEFFKKAY